MKNDYGAKQQQQQKQCECLISEREDHLQDDCDKLAASSSETESGGRRQKR